MTQSIIQELAKPWGIHVPSITGGVVSSAADIANLERVARFVQQAFMNKECLEELPKIVDMCWSAAQGFPKPSLILRALRICAEILPPENKVPIIFKIGGQERVYPGYYKLLLAKESRFFHALFFGSFREGNSNSFVIENTSLDHFETMLKVLEDGSSAFPDMTTDKLVEFLCQASFLEMNSVFQKARKLLLKIIKDLPQDTAHIIYERLGFDAEIRKRLNNYYEKIFNKLNIEERVKFVKEHRNKLPYINLGSRWTFGEKLTLDALTQIIPCCHGVQTLTLTGPTVKLANDSLTALSDLRELVIKWASPSDLETTLPPLTHLQRLCLAYNDTLNDSALNSLSLLKNVQELTIWGSPHLNDRVVSNIALELTRLRSLSLPNCQKITSLGFAALTHLRQLQELNLEGTNIQDRDLTLLLKLDVKILNLSVCRGIQFREAAVTSPSSLRTLNLISINLTAVNHFPSMTNLEVLNLSDNKELTSKDLTTILGNTPHLNALDLTCCEEIDDEASPALNRMTNLRHLRISKADFTDNGLFQLGELAQLRSLSLSSITRIRDFGMIFLLRGLAHLKSLDLAALSITDRPIKVISLCSKLRSLSLCNCDVSSKALSDLSSLSNLQNLRFVRMGIFPNDLLNLATSLQQLRHLTLHSCSKLMQEHASALKARCSHIKKIGFNDEAIN